MEGILTVLITVLMIGILVFVHELGHFLAAKAVGVKVEKFAIGFGPKLFKFYWLDTEFSVRLIWLGGFVQMYGDSDPSSVTYDDKLKSDPRSYISKNPLQKLFITVAGVASNFVLAVILFGIYFFFVGNVALLPQVGQYNFFAAEVRTPVFIDKSFGYDGEAGFVLEVNGQKINNYQDFSQGVKVGENELKILVREEIVSESLLLQPGSIDSSLDPEFLPTSLRESDEYQGRLLVNNIADEGLLSELNQDLQEEIMGAYLLSLSGQEIYNNQQLLENLRQNLGNQVELEFIRPDAGQKVNVSLQLPNESDYDQNKPLLGLDSILILPEVLGVYLIEYPNALVAGFAHTVNTIGYNGQALVFLISEALQGDTQQLTDNVGSVVAVGSTVGQVISLSDELGIRMFLTILNLTALFSAVLAFMNLLPIPVLDGGNVIFILIEWVRGKPLPPKLLNVIYLFFFILLIVLGLVVIGLDVLKLLAE